ncbi:MAG TPA: ribonuclease H-like domain-containing protein [Bryobacteraceae bacterium]|nr:ribonuclease H-like domain-containing protein [Bryobacteraceae bacterium]
MNDLRLLIEQINRKYDARPLGSPRRMPVEEFLPGEEIETPLGRHFQTERLWEHHRRHGSADIGALAALPHDLLSSIGEMPSAPPETWAFLDTETTGLSGSISTCAFLVGVGRIAQDGFRVRQFFMRGYCEEASLLDALTAYLQQFDVLVTYNGASFDQPLLESRYRLHRLKSPFMRLPHLDLLYGARRLWKFRFDSCRLVDLENQVLGFEREGDIPGAMIPYVYFEYLRTKWIERLVPVFHHNQLDILTLACLTGIVPGAFKDGNTCTNGAELTGVARWLAEVGELAQALPLFKKAIEAGLADDLLFRTLWDIARLEARQGNQPEALAVWAELAESRNPFRAKALVELAKHAEHAEKDYAKALRFTENAIDLDPTSELEKREQRLRKRLTPSRKAR